MMTISFSRLSSERGFFSSEFSLINFRTALLKMMKLLLLVCAIFAVTSADFTRKNAAEIKAAREACWDELHLSDNFRESMKKYEYPDDAAIHQAIKCTGLKLGVWCEHEGYHRTDLITQFGEDAAPIFDKCLSKRTDYDSVEKWAWHDWKCFVDNGLKDHYKKVEN
ncbi:general odorant-binding protein 99b-like [Condylostylus longicornis]|uniref:general odorant-binding protein 99b-like n=1 Tax=Condylostylus longicornis TaxID=2530218 RepID=UPI00244DAAA9|nr:general odorant-binding protein 99b-like [Condylostylus longicornis]